jgi:hypothetical protein
MEQQRSPLAFLLDLVARGYGAEPVEHDAREMYAEFVPDANEFGGHELEGLITQMDRYALTLCVDGRVYDVVLREATAFHPHVEAESFAGKFVRIHGTWSDDGFHANCITRIG